MRPFSFPDPKSLNLHSLTQISSDEKKKQKRSVKFPVNVLMQQAIIDGDVQLMKQLISKHGHHIVNEPEPSRITPMMRCVFEDQMAALHLLVELGADLAAQDNEKWTVLHVAASMDNMDAAKLVLMHSKKCPTQVRSVDGERPIDLAESADMAQYLLEADLARKEIDTSVKNGKDEFAILKLVHAHFKQSKSIHDFDQVMQSSTNYDSLLHMAASKNYPRLASYLLSRTLCELEMRDRRGRTALHTAVLHKSIDMVLLLVECGASVSSLTASMEVAFDLTQDKLIKTALREQECIQYL